MDWEKVDWHVLERLRSTFLDGTAGREEYWRGEGDLAAYDLTFAQRIGWKWDWVLADLSRRGWRPPEGEVLDWGCGSGIAGRTFLRQFQEGRAKALVLHDRSVLAMDYAKRRAIGLFPGIDVRCRNASDASAPTFIVSHVLGELAPHQVDALVAQLRQATAVLWVEPGAYEISRALIAIRERLRGEFQIVAPCTHHAVCGLLAPQNQRHWCHHFARTPTEAFMDANWGRFARMAGIDLRSLPLSFLVLDKRGALPLPAGAVRVIGRPRVHKDAARLFGCDAFGVRERRLAKRAFPQEYRLCKRGDLKTLQDWTLDGDEIIAVREVLPQQ